MCLYNAVFFCDAQKEKKRKKKQSESEGENLLVATEDMTSAGDPGAGTSNYNNLDGSPVEEDKVSSQTQKIGQCRLCDRQ